MLPVILAAVLGVCDLGRVFSTPDAWKISSVDFAVEYQSDGFEFASQKRDIVNCLRRGGCTWHGLEVWEARVYFSGAEAKRVEMSLYNRGDDGEGEGLDSKGLARLLSEIAAKAQPKGKIGSNPSKKKLHTGGYQFTKSFDKGVNNVELVWGTDGVKAKTMTADYVRVTMYPKGGAKPKRTARAGVAGSVSAAKVKSNLRKNEQGDVWVDNVPMVDQGQKGYCAAATSERLLRYYGFNIDEHEIAQLAGTTATGGTSISEMIEAVRAVGSKCRLGFQSVVSMSSGVGSIEKDIEEYNEAVKGTGEKELVMGDFISGNIIHVGEINAAMKPKVLKKMRMKDSRYKKFLAGVKTQIDKGIPLFWGVTLGKFPEPGIPQNAGGHIRLIVGYNTKTSEILYSDSWGAGHELKRMPQDWAFTITHDLFFLRPL